MSEGFREAALSHMVVTSEAQKAADIVRRKFDSPAADDVSCGSTEASAIWVVGTKKNGMHAPWIRKANAMVQKLALLATPVLIRAMPARPATPMLTRARASKRCMRRGTIGESTTASTPPSAVV